jgi:mono/diheme cytochrome c family protein
MKLSNRADKTNGTSSAALLGLLFIITMPASCRQSMADQPKYETLKSSSLFGDGRSARPVPAGTISRDADIQPQNAADVPLTRALLERGRERFNIYCAPCHGETGDGRGMVVLRGFRHGPPSLHIDRLREAAAAHFVDVISNGFGAMQNYAAETSPEDRWAIAGYIRALQLSQSATAARLPEIDRRQLESIP